MTPYQYVSNNPIMRVDPTGMEDHDYKVNKQGQVTKIRDTNDNFDRIYNEDLSENITVSKSFLWGTKTFEKFEPKGSSYGKNDTYNIYNEDVKNGKNIFNFFAKNTRVEYDYNEFSNSKTGTKFATIHTSHISDELNGGYELIKSILDRDKNIKWNYSEHVHPNVREIERFYPSGWTYDGKGGFRRTNGGDRKFYERFSSDPNYNKRIPKWHHVKSIYLNKTIKYNDKVFEFIN